MGAPDSGAMELELELFFTPIKWLWVMAEPHNINSFEEQELEEKWNQEFTDGGDPQNVWCISEIHIYFCHGLLKYTTL